MGQNNRQRRSAKQRERAQKYRARNTQQAAPPPDFDQEQLAAGAACLLFSRVLTGLIRGRSSILDRQDFDRCAGRHQQAAIDEQFRFVVNGLIENGWTPLDLFEIVRRKSPTPAITHLLDMVAAKTEQHPGALIDPRWQRQLDQLEAVAPRNGGQSPSFAWSARVGLDWPAAIDALLAVLAVACALPTIERVMPAPGERADPSANNADVDGKVLRRVRALLAKAESTEHPEEADALTAKAQELMTRYSIERAVAESTRPVGSIPVSRRLWLESPYVDAKALLVEVVADANNCRAIHSQTMGFVSVVGHPGDLDLVELLVTSLLVQASRAMNQAGPQVNRHGESRTRSFRQSFLVSYASRIGERLRESAHTTEASYDGDHHGVLVPVLAARREAVQGKVSELFPELVTRRLSVSNAAGWGAGRAAADRAQLEVRESIRTRAS